MNYEILVIGFLLLVFSIIDYKFKKIPSIFITSTIFLLLVLHQINLYFGILAFVYAYLLHEFGFIEGVADIKIIVIIGLMIQSLIPFMVLMFLIVLYGTVWKILIKYVDKEQKVMAFVPVLFCIYVTLALTKLLL